MRKRVALAELLDKHRVSCPRCRCDQAVVVVNARFEAAWQCVTCEARWPATPDETALLLGSAVSTIN